MRTRCGTCGSLGSCDVSAHSARSYAESVTRVKAEAVRDAEIQLAAAYESGHPVAITGAEAALREAKASAAPVRVELTSAATCLQSLDDPEMRRALEVEVVGQTARGTVYGMSREAAERLLNTFRSNYGPGWDGDNPGAASRAAAGAVRRIRAALGGGTA